jgi:hypothetical protein
MGAVTATAELDVRAIRLEYTAPALTASVRIQRKGPSGTAVTVRGFDSAARGPGLLVARDFEAPIGVPLTYTVTARNSGGTAIDTATVTVTATAQPCPDTWLTDLARPTNTLRVLIEQLPDLAYSTPTTVHDIIGRRTAIVTSDIARTPAFELSVLTETLEQRDATRAVLGNGVTVLLRTPPEDGIGNLYFAVTEFHEQRIVGDGVVPDRRFVVSGRQVDRPDPILYVPQAPGTYATVKAGYATYAALKAARASYDAVLYDYSGAAADIVPWPPTDL